MPAGHAEGEASDASWEGDAALGADLSFASSQSQQAQGEGRCARAEPDAAVPVADEANGEEAVVVLPVAGEAQIEELHVEEAEPEEQVVVD